MCICSRSTVSKKVAKGLRHLTKYASTRLSFFPSMYFSPSKEEIQINFNRSINRKVKRTKPSNLDGRNLKCQL